MQQDVTSKDGSSVRYVSKDLLPCVHPSPDSFDTNLADDTFLTHETFGTHSASTEDGNEPKVEGLDRQSCNMSDRYASIVH